ncbi:MAG: glutathione S-transferase family protein [Gemmobacter sp.]|nr:glutathione S-transferase family protein [Gemmobacter sp.]
MYKIYGTIKSRAARVVWLLEELGVPYEHVNAGPRSPEVMAVNPTGKVPVLEVEGTAISDSTAILQFLADRHGALTFPAGTVDRARQDSMTHFLLDELDSVLWTAARHSFILPEDKRHPQVKESLKWEYARSLTRLAERLGAGPFLMGDTVTVPDILAAHCLIWGMGAKFPAPEGVLADYLDRMRARPAFQRAMAR